ncbi:MAG: hypothetical protein L0220_26505 [Acidobacteria bacterium]|nr:hypothetical protein [Acidobacteriota bacterium]
MNGKINRTLPGYKEMSDDLIKTLVEQVLEGYTDLLITDETDSLDRTYLVISRVVAARGPKISAVFELPLFITTVIRRLLAEDSKEITDRNDDEPIKWFNQALEKTENTGHRAACRFLDVYQEHLEKRIHDHNDYLSKMQEELGIELSSFRIEPEGGDAV